MGFAHEKPKVKKLLNFPGSRLKIMFLIVRQEKAVFGLPLTYMGNPEGDALDDDEAGWNCGENAGL